jgi:hypothetical protein
LPPLTKIVVPPPRTGIPANAAERRQQLEALLVAYTGTIAVCPPETISAQVPARMGRPPIGDHAQTNAERQKAWRLRKKQERSNAS